MFEVFGAFMALYGFDFFALRGVGGCRWLMRDDMFGFLYCCLGVQAVRAGCCVASAGWGALDG